MAVDVFVHDEGVEVDFTGLDVAMCFARHVTVPMEHVVGARIATWDEVRPDLGWRVGGGYWPGWFATGWYTVPGHKGDRQLLCVYRDRDELLVIDTDLPRPSRLVLQHPDRHDLAWWIGERLDARR